MRVDADMVGAGRRTGVEVGFIQRLFEATTRPVA
jgi:hypothetical protein